MLVYLYHVSIRSQYLDLGLGRERRPYLGPINNCIIFSLTDIYCYWLRSLIFCPADFLWFFSANRIIFTFSLLFFPLPFIPSIPYSTPHPHQSPHCCLCSWVLSLFFPLTSPLQHLPYQRCLDYVWIAMCPAPVLLPLDSDCQDLGLALSLWRQMLTFQRNIQNTLGLQINTLF